MGGGGNTLTRYHMLANKIPKPKLVRLLVLLTSVILWIYKRNRLMLLISGTPQNLKIRPY